METHDPNAYPTILGGVSRGFWTPFLDWGARSAIFCHLKTGTFVKTGGSLGENSNFPRAPGYLAFLENCCFTTLFRTKIRLMVAIHSKDVPEILPLYRMTKFDFPPHFLKGLMHSFPMMYNTMGSKLDGLAGRGHFLQKIAFEMAV